jgi:hypothetical protein
VGPHWPHWPSVHSLDDIWGWLWSNWWSERRLQGKPKNSEKTCPSATLSHHKSQMTRSGFEPRTAAVGSQRLTAWAMARPYSLACSLNSLLEFIRFSLTISFLLRTPFATKLSHACDLAISLSFTRLQTFRSFRCSEQLESTSGQSTT